MNKTELIDYISKKHNCTKIEAEKAINMFTTSVMEVLGKGEEIALIGFGNFGTVKIPARTGRNPQTGKPLDIAASIRPKFTPGKALKDACNKNS